MKKSCYILRSVDLLGVCFVDKIFRNKKDAVEAKKRMTKSDSYADLIIKVNASFVDVVVELSAEVLGRYAEPLYNVCESCFDFEVVK